MEKELYSSIEVQAMLYDMGERMWRWYNRSSDVDTMGHNVIGTLVDKVIEEGV